MRHAQCVDAAEREVLSPLPLPSLFLPSLRSPLIIVLFDVLIERTAILRYALDGGIHFPLNTFSSLSSDSQHGVNAQSLVEEECIREEPRVWIVEGQHLLMVRFIFTVSSAPSS